MFDALRSPDRVERLFPEADPLYRIVRPTFDTIRRSLAGVCVSAIWVDSDQDPSREGFRPSYDKLFGPGSTNVMPFIATWLSTGDDDHPQGNVVLLPETIDRTIVAYMKRAGLLGRVEYVANIRDLKAKVAASGRRVYSIDDLGADFDAHSMVGSELSGWLNRKDELPSISAHTPVERVVDMYDATLDDFRAVQAGDGRVFLKTNNTESAGAGVFICRDEAEFERQLAGIREKQRQFGLNRRLCIQQELRGRNRNFQVFLDPERRDAIQVVAVTDQLMEADGKTYKASVNYPITAENLRHVGPVILDMVDRIWGRHPGAFGFLMCDFFQLPDDRIVIYDPGIRPTGNTATAMATHLGRKLTGDSLYVANFHLRTGVKGLRFAEFLEKTGDLTDPARLARTRTGVLPWGWNDQVGFGVLIGLAPSEPEWNELRDGVLRLWNAG